MSAALIDSVPVNEFLADLDAVGVRPTTRDGIGYGVLEARSDERYWLLPTRPVEASIAGLAMLQPITRGAAVAKLAAAFMMRLRLTRLWAGRRVFLSALPTLPARSMPAFEACAYFTGTTGPHRKTSIQLMGRKGEILGYCKLTRNPVVAGYLRNEAQALDALRSLDLRTCEFPTCLGYDEGASVAILVTDSLKTPGCASPRSLGRAHVRFLQELAVKTARTADGETVARIADELEDIASHCSVEWRERFKRGMSRVLHSGEEIRLSLAHGDFTPWNCFLTPTGLYAFDWEYSRPDYPVGYDLVRFNLCVIRPGTPGVSNERMVAQIASFLLNDNSRRAAAHYLLVLLMHCCFYMRRLRAAGNRPEDWRDEGSFAALVEDMLVDESRWVASAAKRSLAAAGSGETG